MKKMIAALCSLTTVLSGTSITAFVDTPVPVEVEPAVYEKLLETTWICDPNQDGIVTEEELRKTDRLIIDMDGVSDLSWFEYLDSCKLLCVTGGSITDYSTVKNLPKLIDLQMHSVPITDISFVKDMNLENCTLDDMPQITMKQRLEVAQWDEEITIEQGFQKRFGVTPRNILGDELKCKMYVDDISVARITNGFNASSGTTNSIYAVESGKTTFHIYAPDETEVISGTITVTESTPVNPQLGDSLCTGIHDTSYYYDKTGVALQNGTLYGFNGSEVNVCEQNVKAYDSGYRIPPNRVYQYFDVVAKTDGTLLLNGKVIPDIDCADIQNECIITNDGILYGIYPDGKSLSLVKIADDFKEFSYTADDFYINKNGEVIAYSVDYDENEKPYVSTYSTGIMNPISMHYNLFVDENNVLWHLWLKSGKLGTSEIAEQVTEVGYYQTGEYYSEEYLYKTKDGTYHSVYKDESLTPVEYNPAKYGFLQKGQFYINQYKDDTQGISGNIDWFLTAGNTLTIDNNGEHSAITNVACVINSEYDKERNQGYGYFFRTDGSIWRYCFETKAFEEVVPFEQQQTETISGDVDMDGKFDVSDVVLLQKWLLGVSDTKLKNWKAADFYDDDKLDVFDLCLMKKELLK